MDPEISLKEFDDVLTQTRTESISNVELGKYLSFPLTTVRVFYIYSLLKNDMISADILLEESIKLIASKSQHMTTIKCRLDLIIFGFSLKFKATQNLYLKYPGRANFIHILAFVAHEFEKYNKDYWRNISTLSFVMYMLIYHGALLSSPVFSDGKYNQGKENATLFDGKSGEIVSIYLRRKLQLNNLVDNLECFPRKLQETLIEAKKNEKPDISMIKLITDIGTYVDEPRLILKERKFKKFAMAYDLQIIEKHIEKAERNDLESMISYSILYYLNDLFRLILIHIGKIKYKDMNVLLINLRDAKDKNRVYLYNEVLSSIRDSVIAGVEMDYEQVRLLNSISTEASNEIMEIYKEAKWIKDCKVRDPRSEVTEELRDLAYYLGIFDDKTIKLTKASICEELKKRSEIDPTQLIAATIEMNKNKITAKSSDVESYISPEGSTVDRVQKRCRNEIALTNNVYELNELDLAIYKDENGVIWCITKDMFPNVLKYRANPYTGESIPEEFAKIIENKMKILARLDKDRELPVPVSISVNFLREESKIVNKDRVEENLLKFERLAYANGVDSNKLRNLKKEQWRDLIHTIGEDINFSLLSETHGYVTLANTAMEKFAKDENYIKIFFNYARGLQNIS